MLVAPLLLRMRVLAIVAARDSSSAKLAVLRAARRAETNLRAAERTHRIGDQGDAEAGTESAVDRGAALDAVDDLIDVLGYPHARPGAWSLSGRRRDQRVVDHQARQSNR